MQTLAQRHRLNVLAQRQAAAAPADPHGPPTGSAYELMQAQLHEHLRTLKSIKSVERKIDVKSGMLIEYDAYLEGVLQADAGGQNLVLATLLVWNLDAGKWQRALQLARYALKHGLKMPDNYQRDLPTLLVDEVSEAVIAGKLAGNEAMQALAVVLELTCDTDVPDQARAKIYKALGWAVMGKTATLDVDPKKLPAGACEQALPALTRALELFPQIGVKKDVERLQRRIGAAP
jgi:hypothetical protein